jgi:ABC-type branched-subunit amino acid transport system permease subunit
MVLLGLNLLTGYNGQISLGHGAFYALGAYTSAIMIDRFGIPYGWTIPVAGLVCLVVGFLFGIPALRLEGLYLALATFALAVFVFFGCVPILYGVAFLTSRAYPRWMGFAAIAGVRAGICMMAVPGRLKKPYSGMMGKPQNQNRLLPD